MNLSEVKSVLPMMVTGQNSYLPFLTLKTFLFSSTVLFRRKNERGGLLSQWDNGLVGPLAVSQG